VRSDTVGRSVTFYMGPGDEARFFDLIRATGNGLYDDRVGADGGLVPLLPNQETAVIASADSRIVKEKFVNTYDSDVMFLHRSHIVNEQVVSTQGEAVQGVAVEEGSLWVELRYWNDQGILRTKPDWLRESFDRYKRWLVKEFVKYKYAPGFNMYIGPEAMRLWREGARMSRHAGEYLPGPQ